jgi:integrase
LSIRAVKSRVDEFTAIIDRRFNGIYPNRGEKAPDSGVNSNEVVRKLTKFEDDLTQIVHVSRSNLKPGVPIKRLDLPLLSRKTVLLNEITAARVSEYRAQRLSSKAKGTERSLAAATVNRPLSLLRHLLRLAHEEWELLATVPKIRLEKEPQGRIRWLEPDEEVRLLDACAKSFNKSLLPVVTVALETGLRKGELLGLEWDRVDLSRGVLRLEVTKSGKRREVPMRQAVYTTLAGLPEPHEGRVWRTGSVRKAFENAVTGAELEDFHFHDLRHTFASRYVMRGGSLPALQQILGHATLAMTMRYSHLSPRHLRDEMEKTDTATAVPTELTNSRAQARAHEPIEGVALLAK